MRMDSDLTSCRKTTISLPETNIAPENRPGPQKDNNYSLPIIIFVGDMLVSGTVTKVNCSSGR